MRSKLKIFVDCRWYAQPNQGVVSYINGLHKAAEEILSKSQCIKTDIEFWYGVESFDDIGENCYTNLRRTLVIGKRSMLWRLFVMPLFLRKHSFDFAHFNYIVPIYSLGCKYINTLHDVLFLSNSRFFGWKYIASRYALFGLSARLSKAILTVSDQSKVEIRKYFSPTADIFIVPNGCTDYSDLKSKQIGNLINSKFLLTVGRVEPRKNYSNLVTAFCVSELHNSGFQMVIVGFCPDEFRSELNGIVGKPGVQWLSGIDNSELKWLYENCVGFVFPSFCEGFGIPVIEAMSIGSPVAISSTYPLSDVLSQADFVFDPNSIEEISVSLRNLARFTKNRDYISPTARKYNWSISAKLYIDIISNLTDGFY